MNKDKFKIVETNNPKYRYIIEPTMYISITRYIPQVAEQLKIINYKGKVIFDNGLITGNTIGRFVEAYFNGKTFDSSSFITVFNIPEDVKELADKSLEEIKKSLIKPPEEKKPPKKATSKSSQNKDKPKKNSSKVEKDKEEK